MVVVVVVVDDVVFLPVVGFVVVVEVRWVALLVRFGVKSSFSGVVIVVEDGGLVVFMSKCVVVRFSIGFIVVRRLPLTRSAAEPRLLSLSARPAVDNRHKSLDEIYENHYSLLLSGRV